MHFHEGDVNTTPGIEQPVRLGSLKGICNLEAVTASVRIRGASPSVYTFVISLRLLMFLLSKTETPKQGLDGHRVHLVVLTLHILWKQFVVRARVLAV